MAKNLVGASPDRADGLATRVQRLELFRKIVVWLAAADLTKP